MRTVPLRPFLTPDFLECCRSAAERTCRIHNIIQNDAVFAFNTAYDVHDFGLVCFFAAFVNDSEVKTELHGKITCAGDRADIRRYNDIIIRRFTDHITIMLDENITTGEIINGNIEKALNLCSMQIHCKNSVCTSGSNKVCHQLCGNRVTASGFTILPGIAEVGNHGSDAAGRGTAAGINHNEELHQIIIDMIAGAARHMLAM